MLEFQLTADSVETVPLWLGMLALLSAVITVLCFLQFAGTRFAFAAKLDLYCKVLLAVLASVQIFAWHLYFYRASHDTVAIWCFATALVGGTLVWRIAFGPLANHPRLAKTLPIALAGISIIELAGFAQATRNFSESADTLNVTEPGLLVVKPDVVGATDLGTTIALCARETSVAEYRKFLNNWRLPPVAEQAMLRQPPFIHANCHGWVFAGGKHIVQGENVDTILSDNGYVQVLDPQANDVVVYRSDDGNVNHTGIVRGEFEGKIMVESKWGMGAVYLHAAETQPYSQNFEYYRTARRTHDIHVNESTQASDPLVASLNNSGTGHASQSLALP